MTEPTEKSKHLSKFAPTDKYKSNYDRIFSKEKPAGPLDLDTQSIKEVPSDK